MTAFLSIRNLHKSYHGNVAVQNVSLDIRKGEFVTFLGPSGSGKSTTLYVIAGLMEPTGGDVLVNGRTILDVPSNHRNIGMVFQKYTLFPNMTVRENIAFPLVVRKRPRDEIEARTNEMLRLVRMEQLAGRYPAQMSGGQQQRVAIARAMVYEPEILLMDEPLSALDKKLREEIQGEIKRVHERTGVTILYVTHDQEEALRLSDRIILFNTGRVEQIGTCTDLYTSPRSRFAGQFLGNSNFMPVEIMDAAAGTIRLPGGACVENVRVCDSGDVDHPLLMMRPEDLTFRKTGDCACSFDGQVRSSYFLGNVMNYEIEIPGDYTLTMRVYIDGTEHPPQTGDRVSVGWLPHKAIVFR
ncbi:MAG: ABC transporter ATP-binding protein [Komagataeibacter saccharivorans]|uniref:ABC transporter ATP-binding protein n=1 Tax=Komagataeibacter saccharivorans TaxID=265959 RepID=UPI0039E8A1A5